MSVRLLAHPHDHRPRGRPLVVVDVDEVVLAFVAPLAAFLERKGFGAVHNLMGGVDAWAGEVDPNMRRY